MMEAYFKFLNFKPSIFSMNLNTEQRSSHRLECEAGIFCSDGKMHRLGRVRKTHERARLDPVLEGLGS